jgi:CRP-like cAMP-binding protein
MALFLSDGRSAMPHEDTMFIKTNVDVLSFMEPDQLRKITPDIEHHTYQKGSPVIFKGEITEGFYIVKKGSVQAARKAGDAATLKTGDFFGEISIIEEVGSVETIKALEDGTEIIMIPSESFAKLTNAFPLIMKGLKDAIAKRQAGEKKE